MSKQLTFAALACTLVLALFAIATGLGAPGDASDMFAVGAALR